MLAFAFCSIGAYLGVSTAVIQDDVSNAFDAIVPQNLEALPQVTFCPILRVQIVEVAGKVALSTDSIAWRGKPEGSDSRISNAFCSVSNHL